MQQQPSFIGPIQALRLGNNILKWTTSERLLGVQADDKLCWSDHAATRRSKVLRVQAKFTPTHALPPSKAIRRLLHKGDTAISYVRFDSVGMVQQDALEKLHARAGRIAYGLPWDTSAKDVLTQAGWDSLETTYKVRLTEFVLKCMIGFTVTEFKDLFVQMNSGRRRNENIILPRPETNFIRNSIRYRGAIAWNSLTNKE